MSLDRPRVRRPREHRPIPVPPGQMSQAQVCARIGIDRTTLSRWIRRGLPRHRPFPLPRLIAARLRWDAGEVEAWWQAQPRVRGAHATEPEAA